MTDNTTAAREYLERYQSALRELDYYADRIWTLEARILRGSSPTDSRAGWTGEYVGRAKDGRGQIVTRDPDELVRAWKKMAVPRARQGTQDPKSGERLVHAMIQRVMEYEEKALAAEKLCHEIEASIDRWTTGNEALVLKYRYIEDLTYDGLAERMSYSRTQIRNLLSTAMERFAEGWRGK